MTKIAIVQLKASKVKTENLHKILRYIKQAGDKDAQLIAFPEFMMFYTPSSQTPLQLASQAETIDGNFVQTIARAAKENHIQVIGTFYEKSERKDRVYDTAFLIDQNGKLQSYYRKIHLYDALGFKESKKIMPGSKIPLPIKSKIGKIGMLICYDLRFPEMSRSLVLKGADILVAPSAWVQGESKEDHWITINKTRAIENGSYVIAPDQVGNIYCGRSLVVDPFGKILVDMKQKEGMKITEISLTKIKETRTVLPLLRNRRSDLY